MPRPPDPGRPRPRGVGIAAFLFVLAALFTATQAGGNLDIQLETYPLRPIVGQPTTCSFLFKDIRGSPIAWTDLVPYHAAKLHVVVMSYDHEVFGHVHPEDFWEVSDEMSRAGNFSISFVFPRGGKYVFALDYTTRSNKGPEQDKILFGDKYLYLDVDKFVPGEAQVALKPEPAQPLAQIKTFKGLSVPPGSTGKGHTAPILTDEIEGVADAEYRVRMDVNGGKPVYRGDCVEMAFTFSDISGKPIEDLSPYLEAEMHVAIVHQSFSNDTITHTHVMDHASHGDHMSHAGGSMTGGSGGEHAGHDHGSMTGGSGRRLLQRTSRRRIPSEGAAAEAAAAAAAAASAEEALSAVPLTAGTEDLLPEGYEERTERPGEPGADNDERWAMPVKAEPTTPPGPDIVIPTFRRSSDMPPGVKSGLADARAAGGGTHSMGPFLAGDQYSQLGDMCHEPFQHMQSMPPPPEAFGPTLKAYARLDKAGNYTIFGQTMRGGKIILVRFAIQVLKHTAELGQPAAPSQPPGALHPGGDFALTLRDGLGNLVLWENMGDQHGSMPLHVTVVSGDGDIVAHVHPTDYLVTETSARAEKVTAGTYRVPFKFPASGRYAVVVHYMYLRGEDLPAVHVTNELLLVVKQKGRDLPPMALQYTELEVVPNYTPGVRDKSKYNVHKTMAAGTASEEVVQFSTLTPGTNKLQLIPNNGRPITEGKCTRLDIDVVGMARRIDSLERFMGGAGLVTIFEKGSIQAGLVNNQSIAQVHPMPATGPGGELMGVHGAPMGNLSDSHDLCEEHHRHWHLHSPSGSHIPTTLVAFFSFPKEGQYVVVVQVKVAGEVISGRFVVLVRPRGKVWLWSDRSSWGRVPGADTNNPNAAVALIPFGTHAVLDKSPGLCFARIDIEGTLEVVNQTEAITLCAGMVVVKPGGLFKAGATDAPLSSKFELRLAETPDAASIGGSMGTEGHGSILGGDKLLVSAGGSIEFVGAAPMPPWAKLAQRAAAGSKTVVVKAATGWAAGHRLLLTPSGVDPSESEDVEIASVDPPSGSSQVIHLHSPLRFGHDAEVAVLTRNIVITSDSGTDGGGSVLFSDLEEEREANYLSAFEHKRVARLVNSSVVDSAANAEYLAGVVKRGKEQRETAQAGRKLLRSPLARELAAPSVPYWGEPAAAAEEEGAPAEGGRRSGRKLLHFNEDAYFVKVDEDTLFPGDLAAPLFMAADPPAALHLHGVQVVGMGREGGHWRPAVHADVAGPLEASPASSTGWPSPVFPKAGLHIGFSVIERSLNPCLGLKAGAVAVSVRGNVCYGAGWAGLALEGISSRKALPLAGAGAMAVAGVALAEGNLVSGVVNGRMPFAEPHSMSHYPAVGIYVANATSAGRAESWRVYGNVAAGVTGDGIVWAHGVTGTLGSNVAHSNAGTGTVVNALPQAHLAATSATADLEPMSTTGMRGVGTPEHDEPRVGGGGEEGRVPVGVWDHSKSCAWEAGPGGLLGHPPVSGLTLGKVSGYNNQKHQVCAMFGPRNGTLIHDNMPKGRSIVSPEPALTPPSFRKVVRLEPNAPEAGPFSIGPANTALPPNDGGSGSFQYFSVDLKEEAVLIVLTMTDLTAGERTVPLDIFFTYNGGLPCYQPYEGCSPNPFRLNKKAFHQGQRLPPSQKALTWPLPNYHYGTWYVGVAASNVQFKIGVNVTYCPKGEVGFWTTQEDPTAPPWKCNAVLRLRPNTVMRDVVVPQNSARYFSVDIPQHTSQTWMMINRTGQTPGRAGTIFFRMRKGAIPTVTVVDRAVFNALGVVDASTTYGVPPEIRYSNLEPNLPPGRYYGMIFTRGDTKSKPGPASTVDVMVGADVCGPTIMGDPYHFPPHHEEDFLEAAVRRPRFKKCNVPMPAVYDFHTQKQSDSRPIGKRGGGPLHAYSHFYRIHVPQGSGDTVVRIRADAPEGQEMMFSVYMTYGTPPTQQDLEDYYTWKSEYSYESKGRSGGSVVHGTQDVKLGIYAYETWGKWGDWYIAIDWAKHHKDYNVTITVERGELQCPGEPPCWGRGTCWALDGEGVCRCDAGWSGVDCQVPTTPSARTGGSTLPDAPPPTNIPQDSTAPWGGPTFAWTFGVEIPGAVEEMASAATQWGEWQYAPSNAFVEAVKRMAKPVCTSNEEKEKHYRQQITTATQERDHHSGINEVLVQQVADLRAELDAKQLAAMANYTRLNSTLNAREKNDNKHVAQYESALASLESARKQLSAERKLKTSAQAQAALLKADLERANLQLDARPTESSVRESLESCAADLELAKHVAQDKIDDAKRCREVEAKALEVASQASRVSMDDWAAGGKGEAAGGGREGCVAMAEELARVQEELRAAAGPAEKISALEEELRAAKLQVSKLRQAGGRGSGSRHLHGGGETVVVPPPAEEGGDATAEGGEGEEGRGMVHTVSTPVLLAGLGAAVCVGMGIMFAVSQRGDRRLYKSI